VAAAAAAAPVIAIDNNGILAPAPVSLRARPAGCGCKVDTQAYLGAAAVTWSAVGIVVMALLGVLIRNSLSSPPPAVAAADPISRSTGAPAGTPEQVWVRPILSEKPYAGASSMSPSPSSTTTTTTCAFPKSKLDECLYFQLTAYRANACRSCVEAALEDALSRREPGGSDNDDDDDDDDGDHGTGGTPPCPSRFSAALCAAVFVSCRCDPCAGRYLGLIQCRLRNHRGTACSDVHCNGTAGGGGGPRRTRIRRRTRTRIRRRTHTRRPTTCAVSRELAPADGVCRPR
jgi:hypothetical protein